jgi:hypothetical protein
MLFCNGTIRAHSASVRRRTGGASERGFAPPRRTAQAAAIAFVLAVAALLLASCHGSTLDAIYPGSLGHTPPPAVNLPPEDQGLERL